MSRPFGAPPLADVTDVGALEVVGLRRIWSRLLSGTMPAGAEAVREWRTVHYLKMFPADFPWTPAWL